SAKFNDKVLRYINIVCGLIIIFYGIKLIWDFFQLLPSFL
ncbi:MAG: amino acid transporter, partial [Clostridiales bacterium]|nr:amino acid transporter [Clostridiales bacterium]